MFSPRLIVSGGLRAGGTCNAACRMSYCFARHSKQPRLLQAVSSLPPTTANCFNAAFKAAGLHFRAHTCALHSPLYWWSPQVYPGSFRSLMSWLILFVCPPSSSKSRARALSTALRGWWSRECWGTSHKSPVNPQNPHARSKIASISLNSHQQKYSFPLQVTKGTVVPPSSRGCVLHGDMQKSASTTTQIKTSPWLGLGSKPQHQYLLPKCYTKNT